MGPLVNGSIGPLVGCKMSNFICQMSMSKMKCKMSNIKCQMLITLNFFRSVPPEFLRLFLLSMLDLVFEMVYLVIGMLDLVFEMVHLVCMMVYLVA